METAAVDQQLTELLAELTLEEKVKLQQHWANSWTSRR